MDVFQRNLALGGVPDVSQHVQRPDVVSFRDEFRYQRFGGRFPVFEFSQPAAFVDAHPPPVAVYVGVAAAFAKSPKGKIEIGRRRTVHPSN